MRAELKRLHSPDAWDLRTYTPPPDGRFGLLVQAMVGPAGEVDSEESFDFVFCTPGWLGEWVAERAKTEAPLLVRHYVVVTAYDYDDLERFVRGFCEECTGETWREVATKLGRLGMWEFEDYKES